MTPSDRPSVRVKSGSTNHLADDTKNAFFDADSLPDSSARVSVSPATDGRHASDHRPAASTSVTARSASSQHSRATAVGRLALARVGSLLSARDMAILHFVDGYRYATGTQVMRMFFAGHASRGAGSRAATEVLGRLTAGRLLRRAERRIGGLRGGSASYVYGIGAVGHRLLHGSESGSRGRQQWTEPSSAFLEHTLAITELAVALTEAVWETGDGSSASIAAATGITPASANATPLGPSTNRLVLTPEPRCWRSFQLGLGGRVVLKPDLEVVLHGHDDDGAYEDHWFVEIDRGTESSTALTNKLKIYLDYFRSGIEQQRTGLFPRVLWVVPGQKRAAQLSHIIGKLTLSMGANGLFNVTTSENAIDYLQSGGAS